MLATTLLRNILVQDTIFQADLVRPVFGSSAPTRHGEDDLVVANNLDFAVQSKRLSPFCEDLFASPVCLSSASISNSASSYMETAFTHLLQKESRWLSQF